MRFLFVNQGGKPAPPIEREGEAGDHSIDMNAPDPVHRKRSYYAIA
jgi:hypothetical protein